LEADSLSLSLAKTVAHYACCHLIGLSPLLDLVKYVLKIRIGQIIYSPNCYEVLLGRWVERSLHFKNKLTRMLLIYRLGAAGHMLNISKLRLN
jgi:hypothetical protein